MRRWLLKAGIRYRRAKEWLTSPDPLYTLHKRQRDRLLVLARQAPDGAAVWLDQSWFVRWPYRFWAWSEKPPQVAKRWVEKVDTLALYAALDDESQFFQVGWQQARLSHHIWLIYNFVVAVFFHGPILLNFSLFEEGAIPTFLDSPAPPNLGFLTTNSNEPRIYCQSMLVMVGEYRQVRAALEQLLKTFLL